MYFCVCACMKEAVGMFSVSFASKHSSVCVAGVGGATNSEEECQVDCGRGCLAQ